MNNANYPGITQAVSTDTVSSFWTVDDSQSSEKINDTCNNNPSTQKYNHNKQSGFCGPG